MYFKGGTCLRKCYFSGYRFSEDLDFTITTQLVTSQLLDWVEQAASWAAESAGPDYAASAPRVETVRDDYGSETYEIRVYYRGPLQWGGSPRAIRMDVTRDERVILAAEQRSIIHPYSDEPMLPRRSVTCYPLAEIMAEKIRAVSGQRRFAISRDLYDIHQLVQAGVSLGDVIPLLPAKFKARGVDIALLSAQTLVGRRSDFEMDWDRRLSHLVRDGRSDDFEMVWTTNLETFQQIEDELTQTL